MKKIRDFKAALQGQPVGAPNHRRIRPNGTRTPHLSVLREPIRNADVPIRTPTRRRLLPGYDQATQRVETGAFIMLGLLGAALIFLAAGNALKFSDKEDAITEALSGERSIASARAENTNYVHTNVTVLPANTERTRLHSGPTASAPLFHPESMGSFLATFRAFALSWA